MALCFFMRIDSGMLAFFTTPRLSQKTLAGPSIGIPNIHSLYSRATMSSLQIRNATNSLPNVAASTVFCRLENQIIGAFCTNRKIPLCKHLVITLPAWLACINESRNNYRSSPRLGHVRREFFSDVAVEFFPFRIGCGGRSVRQCPDTSYCKQAVPCPDVASSKRTHDRSPRDVRDEDWLDTEIAKTPLDRC
jgi:hypothetical protein